METQNNEETISLKNHTQVVIPEQSIEQPKSTSNSPIVNNRTNSRNSSRTSPIMGAIQPFVTLALVGVGIFLTVVLVFMSATTIPAGHVGVVKKFGKVQEKGLESGLNWVNPITTSVERIDIRMRAISYSSLAFSNDLQHVNTEASLQYNLNPVLVPLAYRKIGDRDMIESTLVQKAIAESLKAVTSNFSAQELITDRSTVKTQIRGGTEDYITETTKKDGLSGLIIISNLAITDFTFSDEFNRAIEAKVKAEQEALKAVNEKDKIQTQAQAQQVKRKLETDAETYQIKQMAIAEATKIQALAKARAQAIKLEADSLKDNANLIKLRAIERWDGELPTFNGGDTVPLIDFSDMMKAEDKN